MCVHALSLFVLSFLTELLRAGAGLREVAGLELRDEGVGGEVLHHLVAAGALV